MPNKEEKRCCRCGINFIEKFYRYEDEIYCSECLKEQLEVDEKIRTRFVKHYYDDKDLEELGTNDNLEEVMQNIYERYNIERIE